MELNSAAVLARQLMDEHGLKDWQFKWCNSIGAYGQCKFLKKSITLSKRLTPYCEDNHIKDYILHEIAHALVGYGHGHDEVWRQKALEIGCSGNRCGHDVDLPPQYEAICKNGHKHHAHRRLKGASCGECSKQFDPENLLVFQTIKN